MKWLTLSAILFLTGCGGGSQSGSKTTPTSSTTVSSVTVTPASVTLSTGGTQQFMATVTGTGNFSTAVTWSVTGLGSITSTGLYTASGTPGTPFVVATSQQDTSMTGTAGVTVQAAAVSLPGWYGTLVPSDGTAALPLDFDLTQTGTTLTSGPVLIISSNGLGESSDPCANLFLEAPPVPNKFDEWLEPSSYPFPSMTGTINSQNITLSYTENAPVGGSTPSPVVLNGTLGTDAAGYSIISGTYTNTSDANVCVGSSGTFSFNQYKNFSGSYQGNYTIGAVGQGSPPVQANNAQMTISGPTSNLGYLEENGATMSFAAVAPPYECPATPVYSMSSEHAGRFFRIYTDYAGSEAGSVSLTVYGVVGGPDQQGNQLNAYVTNGSIGLPPPSCFAAPTSTFNTGIGGPVVLTQQ